MTSICEFIVIPMFKILLKFIQFIECLLQIICRAVIEFIVGFVNHLNFLCSCIGELIDVLDSVKDAANKCILIWYNPCTWIIKILFWVLLFVITILRTVLNLVCKFSAKIVRLLREMIRCVCDIIVTIFIKLIKVLFFILEYIVNIFCNIFVWIERLCPLTMFFLFDLCVKTRKYICIQPVVVHDQDECIDTKWTDKRVNSAIAYANYILKCNNTGLKICKKPIKHLTPRECVDNLADNPNLSGLTGIANIAYLAEMESFSPNTLTIYFVNNMECEYVKNVCHTRFAVIASNAREFVPEYWKCPCNFPICRKNAMSGESLLHLIGHKSGLSHVKHKCENIMTTGEWRSKARTKITDLQILMLRTSRWVCCHSGDCIDEIEELLFHTT